MNLKRLWNCYTSIPLPIWVCCLRRLVNHISRQLSFPSHPNMKWSLQIHPNGVNEEVQDYSSLFLNRADIGEEEPNVVAVFKILRKEQIHSRLSQPTQQYNHLSPSFGLPRCVHLDLFKNEKSKETSSLKIIWHLICEVQRTWITNFAKYLIPT